MCAGPRRNRSASSPGEAPWSRQRSSRRSSGRSPWCCSGARRPGRFAKASTRSMLSPLRLKRRPISPGTTPAAASRLTRRSRGRRFSRSSTSSTVPPQARAATTPVEPVPLSPSTLEDAYSEGGSFGALGERPRCGPGAVTMWTGCRDRYGSPCRAMACGSGWPCRVRSLPRPRSGCGRLTNRRRGANRPPCLVRYHLAIMPR
jgi:hypothetical protein